MSQTGANQKVIQQNEDNTAVLYTRNKHLNMPRRLFSRPACSTEGRSMLIIFFA
jgi:hypothetical protein